MNVSFNIHNLLTITVKNASSCSIQDLNLRYHYFACPLVSSADIEVTIGPFRPDTSGCVCLDRKFYIRKNYLYLKDSDKSLKWEAQIFDLEKEKVRINFSHHAANYLRFPWCFFPDLIMDLYVLQPLLVCKLAEKNHFLLHAAAVYKDGKATLISGRGGSRKTQHVIELLQRGFDFMSDDFVILSGNKVLALPLSPEVFSFCYSNKSEELPLLNQIRLLAFLAQKNKTLVPVIPEAILKEIFALFLVEGSSIIKRDLSSHDAASQLSFNQLMESTSFVSYKYIIGSFLRAYEYVFPESNFSLTELRLKKSLLETIESFHIPATAIEVPRGKTATSIICG